MALVVRQITGPIETPEHEVVTTGYMRVKLLYPIAEDTTFIGPFKLDYTITAGDLPASCKLTATGWYEFTITDIVEERVWSFQVVLYPDAGDPISVAELWLLSRVQGGFDDTIPPEQIDLSWYGSDGAADLTREARVSSFDWDGDYDGWSYGGCTDSQGRRQTA